MNSKQFLPPASDAHPTFQPCGWYYRKAIRIAEQIDSIADMRNLALTLLDELEINRQAFRELGCWPPVKHDPQKVTAPLRDYAEAEGLSL